MSSKKHSEPKKKQFYKNESEEKTAQEHDKKDSKKSRDIDKKKHDAYLDRLDVFLDYERNEKYVEFRHILSNIDQKTVMHAKQHEREKWIRLFDEKKRIPLLNCLEDFRSFLYKNGGKFICGECGELTKYKYYFEMCGYCRDGNNEEYSDDEN